MSFDFYCKNDVVGRFVGLSEYPSEPGVYRFEEYRSFGHFRFVVELEQSSSVVLTFPRPRR
jgi:hypothetical protein